MSVLFRFINLFENETSIKEASLCTLSRPYAQALNKQEFTGLHNSYARVSNDLIHCYHLTPFHDI